MTIKGSPWLRPDSACPIPEAVPFEGARINSKGFSRYSAAKHQGIFFQYIGSIICDDDKACRGELSKQMKEDR
jgi:hypothetical protein